MSDQEKENKIEKLSDLFNAGKLIVPPYQRAYAWEQKQLEQFVSDMLVISDMVEMKGNGSYYFGHFILEKTEEDCLEIIDGQQRITTFILFLLVCRELFKKYEFNKFINKFETVDYDEQTFQIIKDKLSLIEGEWTVNSFTLSDEKQTLSINKIVDALNFFRELFDEKSKIRLYSEKIELYVEVLVNAHVSAHITRDKAVAVQIFELQNTRGIKLNLIEKVKSKLMKAVYINSTDDERKTIIPEIQNHFAEIYRLEESAIANSFRGEISLEDILLHHLRIVDDGYKLNKSQNGSNFNVPARQGNKEELIINYINERITEKINNSKEQIVTYIRNLSNNYRETVKLVSEELPLYDKKNYLVGDVLILDKSLSLEFFILLYHLKQEEIIKNEKYIRQWEKLLFTRDFHEKYYRKWYRDDFEKVFSEIVKEVTEVKLILNRYANRGFRNEEMIDGSLPNTVFKFIEDNKSNILNNAFYWGWREKMSYILYKYEIEGITPHANLTMLRKVIKDGRSVEHILPQSWAWDWINEDINNITQEGRAKNESISKSINGLGNLLLITGGDNSKQSNKHPKDKIYKEVDGGSYSEHNNNAIEWENYREWEKNIAKRGGKIYEFLKKFVASQQDIN